MTGSGASLSGRTLCPGHAQGRLLLLAEPLSFWGGFDVNSGTICDASHPQLSQRLSGLIIALRGGRGSSSSSSVLAEAVRRQTAPAALILLEPDAIIATGAWVAAELYGIRCPVVQLTEGDWPRLIDNAHCRLDAADGGAASLRLALPG